MAELTDDPGLWLTSSQDDGETVTLHVRGEIDLSNADVFRGAVATIVAEQKPRVLVFEMSQLDFLDSSGIAVLVYAANSIPSIEVRNATDIVRRVLEVAGLAEAFQLS